jgi:glycosyltransferase involved in cell wall biosynthesis
VLLEALRADVAVVATTVGAIPEVIGDSRAGVLVPPGSAAALADGIVSALQARDDADAIRDRRSAADRLSLEARGNALAGLYSELLAANRSTAGRARIDAAAPRAEHVAS